MKIKWHSKYNDTYHYATKCRGWTRITAVISKAKKWYNLKFFDENTTEINTEENFYNLDIAKLYADCFITWYFTY
jgi:hypothetical protein